MTNGLTKQLIRFAELKKEKDKWTQKLKEANVAIEGLSAKLVEQMETVGMTNVKLKKYGVFYLETQGFPNVTDQKLLYASLKERGFGDLIKETVNYQTLRGLCGELLKDNNPLPKGVEVFMKTSIRMRRGNEK